jgi:hypothetical protein
MFENFGALLKGSLWTLPWIILLPLAALALDATVFNPDEYNFSRQKTISSSYDIPEDVEDSEISEDWELKLDDGDYGAETFTDEVTAENTMSIFVQDVSLSLANILLLEAEVTEDVDDWKPAENPGQGDSLNEVRILLLSTIGVNLLFLLLIPCAFGGLNPVKKRVQFYTGFFVNLALGVGIPVLLKSLPVFFMAPGYFPALLFLFFMTYPLPFIAGSRFVNRAFRKAFWFW